MSDDPRRSPSAGELREARRRLAARWASALSVCCAAVGDVRGGDYDGRRIPFLHVDARSRPDVLDLDRVQASEDLPGSGIVGWEFAPPRVDPEVRGFLTWRQQQPVACEFEVAIDGRRHRRLLQMVAEGGLVGIESTWPCPGADRLGNSQGLVTTMSDVRGLLTALSWMQEGDSGE
jgi:hypothetical protein